MRELQRSRPRPRERGSLAYRLDAIPSNRASASRGAPTFAWCCITRILACAPYVLTTGGLSATLALT
eukprot:1869593-Ditylum_brightwellii.AAC.1